MKRSIRLSKFVSELELTSLYKGEKTSFTVDTSELNRPGLQLSGFFEHFSSERIQLFGMGEMTYLSTLPPEVAGERLERMLAYDIPAIIISRNLQPSEDFIRLANEHDIPLLLSDKPTSKISHDAILFLDNELAPSIARHGGLMDIYGVGVFITGESGVGKSEAALELVKRGHRLVADDVVEICKVSDTRLVGEAPEMVRHFMEIRGVGIINVKNMYGVGAVINSKSIDMVIHLELWDQNKEYDRMGLNEDFTAVLGVKIPKLTLPVRPGRNLAIVIEVAASNHRLKKMGYNGAQELNDRVTAKILNS